MSFLISKLHFVQIESKVLLASKKPWFTIFCWEVSVSLLSLQGIHTWHLITLSVETEKQEMFALVWRQSIYFSRSSKGSQDYRVNELCWFFCFFFFHKSVKYQYPSDFHTLKLWGLKGWLWTRSSRQPGLCSSPKLGHKAQNNHSESSKSCWGWSKLPLSNAIWTTVGYFLF